MNTPTQTLLRYAKSSKIHLWWLGFVILSVAMLTFLQNRSHLAGLERESATLHRAASQRAGQHDAHLTALSAIAVAGAGQRSDLFLAVATTISRFYPRIDEVHLVPLNPAQAVIGSVALGAEDAALIRAAAQSSTGMPVLLRHPAREGHYLLVKRSPNSDAAVNALALGIDVAQLLAGDEAFWSRANVGVRLALPNGDTLIETGAFGSAQFSKPLGSASQPLLLESSIGLGVADRVID